MKEDEAMMKRVGLCNPAGHTSPLRSKETRDTMSLMERLAADPRFVRAKKPAVAYVILGEHVHKQASDYANRGNRGVPTAGQKPEGK